MLKPTSDFYEPMKAWVISGLDGYIALEQPLDNSGPVGAYLSRGRGQSRRGTGQAYRLHNHRFYTQPDHKSVRIKAYSDQEAIEIANNRLSKWREANS